MPVHIRKYWIIKNNEHVEEENQKLNKNSEEKTVTGTDLEMYTNLSMGIK